MLITQINRSQLLSILPRGGQVTEVGVFRGGYSRRILDLAEPDVLHLIDPWSLETGCTSSNGWQMPQAYQEVVENLSSEIASGRVVLHRDYSTKVAPQFSDASLDWIYIDALHDYESVRADLLAFKDKVKPDGFILGHDFSNHPAARRYGFGVIRAVREFTEASGYDLVLITTESHPTYLLARADNTTSLPALREALFNHRAQRGLLPIDIHPQLLDHFEQVEMDYANGRKGHMMRFAPPQ